MRLIVTGSLAYDHIMVFPDEFKNHILPDKIHMLNVAFNVENLQKQLGGTAGNIAYTLSLLEKNPFIVGTAGQDFAPYAEHLKQQGLSREHIQILPAQFTAQCFITTDQADNQITAFHGGAMFQAHQKPLGEDFVSPEDLVIVSPNGKEAMVEHTRFCRNQKVKYIFDPGQSIPAFSGEELLDCIRGAYLLVVNDYEWQLVQDKTEITEENVFDYVECLIVTLGAKGSVLRTSEKDFEIKTAAPKQVVDPTGCGDAYRAGLIYGLKNKLSIDASARIASTVASFAIEQHGTQKHKFTLKEFQERYKVTYGRELT